MSEREQARSYRWAVSSDPAPIGRLELEDAVLDVEVPGEARAEAVQHLSGVGALSHSLSRRSGVGSMGGATVS
ncbi:MAG TPA: hypothetical protein VMR89_10030 [Actinomycetota bacterium]|nr:hypothetical protein [Actinomycetota bacterium]